VVKLKTVHSGFGLDTCPGVCEPIRALPIVTLVHTTVSMHL